MNLDDTSQAYLLLANEMLANRIPERDLSRIATRLPPLEEILLSALANRADVLANSQPRLSWTIARVAYSAAVAQRRSLFVQSLAAWYLGRASNYWGQPKKVKRAISQARRGFVKLKEETWIAACDWQLNALAWTKPDLPTVVETLRQALERLE